MSTAYVDTSVLTAIALDEPGAEGRARRLDDFTRLISSNLLEAELRAVFAREDLLFRESAIAGIDWVLPDRPLASEFAAVLETGYLAGRRSMARRDGPLCLPPTRQPLLRHAQHPAKRRRERARIPGSVGGGCAVKGQTGWASRPLERSTGNTPALTKYFTR